MTPLLVGLVLVATPPALPPLRAAATDGQVMWALTESDGLVRHELRTGLTAQHALPPGRRVDAQHLEQAERLVWDPKRARLLVVWQSRNAGPLQGSVGEVDPASLEPRAGRWTFAVPLVPGGGPVVRGEARVLAEPRLVVARVDDAQGHAALLTGALVEPSGEVSLRTVTTLEGPMDGGSRFELVAGPRRIVVATTGSGAQVVALTPSGSLDLRFGVSGVARVPWVVSLGGLGADGDGWVVAGQAAGASAVAVRLDGAGQVDPRWGEEGVWKGRVREGWLERAGPVLAQGAQLAVLVSSYEQREAVGRATLVRLDQRGRRASSAELVPVPVATRVAVVDLLATSGGVWVALNAGPNAFDGRGALQRAP